MKVLTAEDLMADNFDRGRRAGIKEVVEYVDKYIEMPPKASSRWFAKLKEWGMKNDSSWGESMIAVKSTNQLQPPLQPF